jgi:hypothetical protein
MMNVRGEETSGIVGRLRHAKSPDHRKIVRGHVGLGQMSGGRGSQSGQIKVIAARKTRKLAMASKADYRILKAGIKDGGRFTSLRHDKYGGFNLVCVSDRDEDARLHGNSFWVWYSRDSSDWYIVTWAPVHYLIPSGCNLVDLCLECLAVDTRPIWRIPKRLIAKFKLRVVANRKFDQSYGIPPDCMH